MKEVNMKKIHIDSIYFEHLLRCINNDGSELNLKLVDNGSEGFVIKDYDKAIKIYKSFYNYFVDGTYDNKSGLDEHLALKARTNQYSNNHATNKMVVADSLLFLNNYSDIIPIGCVMPYQELNFKYNNFKVLRENGELDHMVNFAILASDAIKDMHNKYNVHRDIHAKNIGITSNDDVCIFDCDGCYIGAEDSSKKPSTAAFYQKFVADVNTVEYDKYCTSLMILQLFSNYYISFTSEKSIKKSINRLRIKNEGLTNYFMTLLNPSIEQEYIGDVLKKTLK